MSFDNCLNWPVVDGMDHTYNESMKADGTSVYREHCFKEQAGIQYILSFVNLIAGNFWCNPLLPSVVYTCACVAGAAGESGG